MTNIGVSSQSAEIASLKRNLGVIEAVALSISIIAPTMAVAFNVTLAAGVAGHAAPLTFLVGTIALAIVGLSFVAFSRRVAHAGSAYAYITKEFGPRAGFLTGWALLLTYLTYGTGTAALVGNFIDAALANYNIALPGLWIFDSVLAVVIAMVLAYRDMRLAARLMLVLEGLSVLAIVVLGIIVLKAVGAMGGLSAVPFTPDPGYGWSGIGYGMVFAVLSFAGFEGAATLGEEARNPNLAIPIAVLGSVILAGLFYVFGSYVEVVGYGLANVKSLAGDSTPLNTLAVRFGSREFATLLDIAAAISAFSCALGSLSAASRMLFALGRAGLSPKIGLAHKRHGTPAGAVVVMGVVMIAGLVLWAPMMGAGNYYGAVGTIGTLALILVYMGVTLAEATDAARAKKQIWMLFGAIGTAILLWPLYNSVYPVPAYPGNLWPYIVALYLVAGGALLAVRPALGRGALE
ncbi:APC family permease [Acidocella sp.]|uniref:APC family permease n=1 Tax=Acidocella sp. TaxID=50710 RepID=UPI00261E3715|nr:APC family permease [Acidocella sp.]